MADEEVTAAAAGDGEISNVYDPFSPLVLEATLREEYYSLEDLRRIIDDVPLNPNHFFTRAWFTLHNCATHTGDLDIGQIIQCYWLTISDEDIPNVKHMLEHDSPNILSHDLSATALLLISNQQASDGLYCGLVQTTEEKFVYSDQIRLIPDPLNRVPVLERLVIFKNVVHVPQEQQNSVAAVLELLAAGNLYTEASDAVVMVWDEPSGRYHMMLPDADGVYLQENCWPRTRGFVLSPLIRKINQDPDMSDEAKVQSEVE